MIGIWHEAARRLRDRKRSAAVIGAALLFTAFLCILCEYTVQGVQTEQAMLKHAAIGTAPALLGYVDSSNADTAPDAMRTVAQTA